MTTTPERPAGSRLRRTARQSGRRALSRLFGLGSPITDYTVEKGIRVPMRDGVDLVADHYAPTDDTRVVGTLLARSPYGRGFPFSTLYGRLYAARGYHVVLQSVRGTPGSGGEFHPFVDEASDGADTVEWLRRQPWFTGRFATIGQSYLGVTQWALLTDPPPELAAAVVTAAPHDVRASMWSTGAFTLDDVLGWSDVVSHQEHSSRLRRMIWSAGARRRLARAMSDLPLGESSRALLAGSAAWFESWIEHREPDTPFWEPYHFGAALTRVTAPVLLIGGWQDSFLSQTLEQYQTLRDRGADVTLIVGPWTHAQLTTTAARRVAHESLEWLDRHLAGDQPGPARNPVRVYINGDDWLELPSWPPGSSSRLLYLAAGAALVDRPGGSGGSSSFTYDPADPTPVLGGPLGLAPQAGYREDSALARRADVLSFTSEPLPSDLYVVGHPKLELSHAANIPHVDLAVRISEVDSRGRSRNVSDGYQRLTATVEPAAVQIDFQAVAHRFRAGSRIRVLVAGGAHPRFDRNLGTGEPLTTAQRLVAATHIVHFGADPSSRLILPATPGRPSADRPANRAGDSTTTGSSETEG
ncbi:MAG: CocE/NonD family hydrolase [Mycobacterium sp.]